MGENRFSLIDGLIINNEFYQFQQQALFDGFIQIMLPAEFFRMPDELVQTKYGALRPEELYITSPDGKVDVNIAVIDGIETELSLLQLAAQSQQAITQANPGVFFEDDKRTELEIGKYPALFDYSIARTMDGHLKTMTCYIRTPRQIISIRFHAAMDVSDFWQEAFQQMAQSVEIKYDINVHFSR